MRLQQILLNLGSNAIKFTSHGEVKLSIQVLRRNDESVTLQFSMQDSGIGIAAETLPHIFDRFYQVDGSATRRFGGLGLGPRAAAEVVERFAREYATTQPSLLRPLIGIEHHRNGAMQFRTLACLPATSVATL